MANIFTPGTPTSGPWYIDREDCIGDSLGWINANTNYLAYNLNTVTNLATTFTPASARIATLYETTAAGVSGGAFTTGDWRRRRLNTLKQHPSNLGVTLSSDSVRFTLPAGTWLIRASAPGYRVNIHQIRLYSITTASVAISGTPARSDDTSTYPNVTRSFLEDIITIAAPNTFEIQHRCDASNSTDGFGITVPAAWGTNNIYTTITCSKIG